MSVTHETLTSDATVTGAGIPHTPYRRVSWGAIFAGVVLVLAVTMLLIVLGAGIGLDLMHPGTSASPDLGSFGTAAGLWWVGSTILALLFGCYAAARLAAVGSRYDGMLHGLVIWGLAALLTAWMVAAAIGGIAGSAFSVIGSTLSAAGEGIKTAVPQVASAAGVSQDTIRQEAQAYLQPPGQNPATMSPEDAQKEIARQLPDLAAGGDKASQAKERIINIMAAQMKLSHDEAAKRFDEAQAKVTQIRDQAAQMAKQAAAESAAIGARISFATFAVLLISAIAAAIGGSLASPRRAYVRRVVREDA